MARGLRGGEITLDQLERKFDTFVKAMPGLTKKALKKGTKVLVSEMRHRYTAAGLKRRSGKLYRGIKVLGVDRKNKVVSAAVGIEMKQVYKAVAHEMGMTVGHGVTLPKRAFVEPTKRAKLEQVKRILLDDLISGYRKVV